LTASTKSFSISKRQVWPVWQAWKRVRADRGAAGIDQESIEEFEKNLASDN
jgi:RNA-directed DNA polymerase